MQEAIVKRAYERNMFFIVKQRQMYPSSHLRPLILKTDLTYPMPFYFKYKKTLETPNISKEAIKRYNDYFIEKH